MHGRYARRKGASCENAKAFVQARLDNIDFRRGRSSAYTIMACEKDVVLERRMLSLKPRNRILENIAIV